MTGAEHYAKAEELIEGHRSVTRRCDARLAKSPGDLKEVMQVMEAANSLIVRAQVHATLANAMATLCAAQMDDWDAS
jgi:hypothetical protein